MRTITNAPFAETQLERLLVLEQDLRSATQEIERTPHVALTVPAGGQMPHRAIALRPDQARTLLRAILPACLALGRTRTATLRMHSALAGFHAALVGTTDASLEDGAIAAALDLTDALAEWLDEARWKQATRRANTPWRRPEPARDAVAERPLLRQSSAAEPERRENAGQIAAGVPAIKKRRRNSTRPDNQVTLLLPIAGEKPQTEPAKMPAPETNLRKSA